MMVVSAPPAAGQAVRGGSRAVALGGATTALSQNVWGNPAGMAGIEETTFAVFGSEAYGLDALRYGSLVFAHPFSWGALAVRASTYGFSAYRQTDVVVGLGSAFSMGTTRSISAGVSVGYSRIQFEPPYGASDAVSLSAGWSVRVLPTLMAAFHMGSVAALSRGAEMPRSFALGVSYRPARSMILLLDLHKEGRWPLSVRAGVEVRPVSALSLRAGATTRPFTFSGGAGLRLAGIRAGVAAQHHSSLGWSPALSFGVAW